MQTFGKVTAVQTEFVLSAVDYMMERGEESIEEEERIG